MRIGGVVVMILVGAVLLAGAAEQTLQVVEPLDVQRYMGKWYAIASIPTSFERQCIQGTTAEYTLLENGQVQVVNTCYDADGNPDVARGRAWIPDPRDPAKLQVSFVNFLWFWLFSAPYWVIDLAPDYSYAVVGHPTRQYGWILSRTPTLPEDVLSGIVTRLEEQGYRFEDFRIIDQSMHEGVAD